MLNNKTRPRVLNLLRMLDLQPHYGQSLFLETYDKNFGKAWFYILAPSRRWGKSFIVAMTAVTDLIVPFSSALIISPSAKQSAIIYTEVVKILKRLNVKFTKINNQEKNFTLENGATLQCGTANNLEASEGLRLSTLIIDEAGLVPDLEAMLNSLTPSLATYGIHPDTRLPLARVVLLGTYKGGEYHKQLIYKGLHNENGYFALVRPSSDNPLNTKEFLETQKELLDDKVYRREYGGEIIDITESGVFTAFDRSKNVIPLSEIQPYIGKNSLIIAGLDIGATDSTAYVLAYVEKGKFYVFDTFALPNLDEELIAKNIKELEAKWGIDTEIRFIDPSAKLTANGLSSTYDIGTYPAKNSIKKGVEVINQLFRTNKLIITDNNKELILQIEGIKWKENTSNRNNGDPFVRVKNHHFDLVHSLRYCVFTYWLVYMGGEIDVI
jgi:hypothetical protein